MGEIKSTLDLVLEKTRDLKLSDEEKREQNQKEIESRIKGLLQKYQDGLLTKNQLIQDYKDFQKDKNLPDEKVLIDEIINRLDPKQDNQFLLEILEEGCGLDVSSIQTVIDDHRAVYYQAARQRTAQLKEILADQHAISGSAVLPNLEADQNWQRQVQKMRSGLEDNLRQAKERLLAD